jgi:hypothetical protein
MRMVNACTHAKINEKQQASSPHPIIKGREGSNKITHVHNDHNLGIDDTHKIDENKPMLLQW